ESEEEESEEEESEEEESEEEESEEEESEGEESEGEESEGEESEGEESEGEESEGEESEGEELDEEKRANIIDWNKGVELIVDIQPRKLKPVLMEQYTYGAEKTSLKYRSFLFKRHGIEAMLTACGKDKALWPARVTAARIANIFGYSAQADVSKLKVEQRFTLPEDVAKDLGYFSSGRI
ncbi:MAG: hypothetical protein ABW189_01985, partial [Rickettsiales bacterium]